MEQRAKKLVGVLAFSIAMVTLAQAQLSYSLNDYADINGKPLVSRKAVIGEASFLFNPQYIDAVLYMPSGKAIVGNKFKLDLQNNRLLFLDGAGVEMEVVSPARRIEFSTGTGPADKVLFAKGYPAIDRLTADNFYQVLVQGKASLLLDTKFESIEYKEYGSAVTTRRTDRLVSLYGFSAGGKMIKLNRPEDLLLVLSDKSAEVTAFMKKENSKVKKQADVEKVFAYYNGLY